MISGFSGDVLAANVVMSYSDSYLWNAGSTWLHAGAMGLVTIASILVALVIRYGGRQRPQIQKITAVLSLFILIYAAANLVAIWALWYPVSWFAGLADTAIAVCALLTLLAVLPRLQGILAAIDPMALEVSNQELTIQITERQQIEAALKQYQEHLETLVLDRTAALVQSNQQLQQEIIDRQSAEQQIQFQAALLNQVRNAVVCIDVDGHVIYWNRFAETLFQWTAAEAIGQPIIDLIVPPDRWQQAANVLIALQQWPQREGEWPLQRKDGSTLIALVTIAATHNDQGQVSGFVGVAADMSDRKVVETALRESEERFRQVANHIDQFFFVRDVCTDKFLYISPAYERLWGRSCNSLYEHPNSWLDAVHPDDRPLVDGSLARQSEGIQVNREYRIIHADGSIRWITAAVYPVYGEDAHPVRLVGWAADITDRKQTEQALRESEARYRSVVDHVKDVIFQTDLEGIWTFLNPAWTDIFAFSVAESLGTHFLEYVHPDDRAASATSFQALVECQLRDCRREVRYVTKTGEIRWIDVDAQLTLDADGNPIGVSGIFNNITERKAAEAVLQQLNAELDRRVQQRTQDLLQSQADLRDSEALLQQLFEEAPLGIGMVRVNDERYFRTNRVFRQLIGYSSEELAQMSFRDFTHPDDLSADVALHAQVAMGTLPSYQMEKRYIRKTGETVWIHLTVTLIRTADGSPLYTVGMVQDITERKQAEQALRQSEERFRRIFDHAPLGIAVADLASNKFSAANPAFCQLLGYSQAEMLALNCERVSYGEDGMIDAPHVAAILSGDATVYQIEKRYGKRDGSFIWGSLTTTSLRDATGGVTHLLGMVQDITERKHAEAALANAYTQLERYSANLALTNEELTQTLGALRSAEEELQAQNLELIAQQQRYQDLFNFAPDGYLVTNTSGSIQQANHAITNLFGAAQSTLVGQALLDFVPRPDDETFTTQIRRVVASQQTHIWELTLRSLAGLTFPAEVKVAYVRNHLNEVATLHWLIRDITIRKQIEATIRQQAEREQLLRSITQRVRQSLNLDAILTTAVTEVRQSFQADRALIFRISGHQGQVIKESVSPDYPELGEGLWSDACLTPENIAQYCLGNPRIVADIADDRWTDCLEQLLQQVGVKSKISAPIIHDLEDGSSQVWGLLIVHACATYRKWDVAEAEFLQQISNQLAIAIQQSDLLTQTQQQSAQQRALTNSIAQIRVSLDLDTIFNTATTEVRQLLNADRVGIFQFNLTRDREGKFICESLLPGFVPALNEPIQIPHLQGEYLKRLKQGQIHLIHNINDDTVLPSQRQILARYQVQASLGIPLLLGSRLWGLLFVQQCRAPRYWEAMEIEFAQQIAAHLAVAIQQSKLYRQVQQELAERELVEAQLRTSLQEKEVLLKEIHHRVKNNFQMVSSLLNLQASAIQTPEMLRMFTDSQRRIKTMALIHEKLYRSTNLAQINFADYVQELVEDLSCSYITTVTTITMTVMIADVELAVEYVISCGLLINELVSNAIKHAFPDGRAGEIKILFSYNERRDYELTVADNGIGLPETVDIDTTESLGLQLVAALTQKLRGTLELDRHNGSVFKVTFSPST